MNILLCVAMAFALISPSANALSTKQGSGAEASLDFLMLGDWGGTSTYPYALPQQKRAAKAMTQFSPRFILGLGDNFYKTGIDTDEYSERFDKTWAEVYTPSVPWYLCAGNHDYKGNVTAQIAYTADAEFWNFPDYNYNIVEKWTETDGSEYSLEVILIDTINLVGMADEQDDHENPAYFHQPTGPKDAALAASQWDWLEETLKASTADFIIVGGHYPVYSVCDHGPTQALEDQLAPLLQQYNAHYMSGHDHCASHVVDEKGVNYILNGMGDECCYEPSNLPTVNNLVGKDATKFYVAKGHNPTHAVSGFTSASVSKDGMVIRYHDQDGEVLFTADTVPLRPRQ